MAFTVQEVFSQETYGRASWSSGVAAAVGGFYFQPPPSSLFVCLFVARADWHAAWRLLLSNSLKMTRV